MAQSKRDGLKEQVREAKQVKQKQQLPKPRQQAKLIDFATPVHVGTRRNAVIKAYEVQCTSPRARRQFIYRFDVHTTLDEAKQRSRDFQDRYIKQGWRVIERAVLA